MQTDRRKHLANGKHFAVSNTKKLLNAGFYGDMVPFCIPKTGFPIACAMCCVVCVFLTLLFSWNLEFSSIFAHLNV